MRPNYSLTTMAATRRHGRWPRAAPAP